jgi:hypothetical protein
VSSEQLTGDGQHLGEVDFSWPRADASGCIGLDASDPGTSCAEIPYRLVIQPYHGALLATAYDGDTYVGNVMFGANDRLEIAILDGHVTFGKNGQGFATTNSTVSGSFEVDTALWDLDSTVGQATIGTTEAARVMLRRGPPSGPRPAARMRPGRFVGAGSAP